MQFIANYDAKNIFGCFENVEQHALAFSKETAAKLFDSGMKIFRGMVLFKISQEFAEPAEQIA